MSLSKQLIILVSVLFLMIFSVNFALSVKNTKTYLEVEANIHAQDTATSLGLSLSPYMVEEHDPIIETMIKAIFDRGYYREIKLVNLDNEVLVALSDQLHVKHVPEWFVNLLPLQVATAESEISSGWQIKGTISVTVNPGYAYSKLYEQVKSAFYYSSAVFVFALLLLLIVVRVMFRSLKNLEQLSLAISEGHFKIIDEIPWTTEVKNLTTSMNSMATKIASIIDSLQLKLDLTGKKLLLDDLTGLNKKIVFETDMKHLFMEDSDAFIYLVKIDSMISIVNERDNEWIERFLIDFAFMLKQFIRQFPDGTANAYRFYGAEFAMLIKNIDLQQLQQTTKALTEQLNRLGQQYQKPDLAHIGIVPFNAVDTIELMLEAAHEAYEQAQRIGINSYAIRTNDQPAKDMAEWKKRVFDCIDNQHYHVDFVGKITSFQTGLLLMEEAFTQAFDENNNNLAMATFFSIAEKFDKIVELEKQVVGKTIENMQQNNFKYMVAVNLSVRTLKNTAFRDWLKAQLKGNVDVAGCLVFSLTAYAVAKEPAAYQEFIEFVHKQGARVLIKRFEMQSMSIGLCKKLRPDFIRLARDKGENIAEDGKKQVFVHTLLEIGKLLDIEIFAENVIAERDYNTLKEIGIAGASR